MKTRTYFAFRIDVWDSSGNGIAEHDWMRCGDGVMLLSSPPHRLTDGTPVSIAQRLSNDSSPWGQTLPITIIGYSIIHEVRGETGQQTWMLVGSASGGPGTDVFATTAGQGNSSSSLMFPPGIGLPHSGKDPNAHIDVYGSCLGAAERGGHLLGSGRALASGTDHAATGRAGGDEELDGMNWHVLS